MRNSYAGYPYQRRSRGVVVVGFLAVVLLAGLVFAATFVLTERSAAEQRVETAKETIVPNISANMIYAIDPSVIENYRASHNIDAVQGLYSYSPENPFSDPAHVNTDITADCVSGVTSLVIDMRQNNDLTALAWFSSLSFLRITHAEYLTDADIAEINKAAALAEVEFVFDRNEITNRQKFADFTQCVCPVKRIIVLNGDFDNENTAYALYHLFGKYYPSVVCEGLDCEFYRQLDEKIQALIDKVDFTNCQNDKDRLLKCMVVVMKHLYYDDEVSDYSQVNDDLYEDSPIYQTVVRYNDCQLSSNLLIDGDRGYGCCTNFTSLLLAVCVKLDIEAYMVDGKRSNDVGFLHDWIYAPADGTYYCLDMTETNRWFKRMAGQFHRYNSVFIEGEKDVMDDPDFYAAFSKEVFETYNDYIFDNYVFFVNVEDIVPKIEVGKTVSVYNAADGPVEKFILERSGDTAEAQSAALKKAVLTSAPVLVIGLVVMLIVARRRYA